MSRPYSKVTVVSKPLAFTVPFTVAPVEVTLDAASVMAVGACAEAVVNEKKRRRIVINSGRCIAVHLSSKLPGD